MAVPKRRTSKARQGKRLESPSRATRDALARCAAEGQWGALSEAAEAALAGEEGRGWLDAHRFAIEALDNLGRPTARDACQRFLSMLLELVPNLRDARTEDGEPLASPETWDWIEQALPRGAPSSVIDEAPNPTPAVAKVEAEPPSGDALIERRVAETLEARDIEGAIRILNEAVVASRSSRARFLWRLRLAEVCVQSEVTALAAPLLDDLAAEINDRRLDSWEEPEFLARVARVRYRCLELRRNRVPDHLREDAYAQLARLDPIEALKYDRD
jgi:type VI secretion system ImpA/VasJ family protein